jgi:hypothetical protein
MLRESFHNRRTLFFSQTVGVQHLGHFALFLFGYFNYFPVFTFAFLCVMLSIAFGSEITTQAHGDGPGRYFRKTRRDDNAGMVNCAGQSRRQGEGNRESIRHSNHNVTNSLACSEVSFDVSGLWHGC